MSVLSDALQAPGKCTHVLRGHFDPVLGVCFGSSELSSSSLHACAASPEPPDENDELLLLSASADSLLGVWSQGRNGLGSSMGAISTR